ncbi:MAG: hypothetical protein EPO29_07240 [Betaproteobacteria bacterium]|nr:MAG: hypothetical protein EPO29_07240 [Betaproteobacteria bacterium]
MPGSYTLQQFVAELRAITASRPQVSAILQQVKPLARRFATSSELRGRCNLQCDEQQGFGFQLLHEEPDHMLAVAVLSWLPGRGTPPHDHGTWGVVVGVSGDEVNAFWQRVDDGTRPGYAELRRLSEKTFSPGDAIAITPEIIHSVRNETDRISVSLHVYGRNINFTGRSQFDPERRTVTPWTVVQN